MKERGSKFTELLRYVKFIKDEKVEIQRYINGLPSFYAYKLTYDEPKILGVTMQKAEQLYE